MMKKCDICGKEVCLFEGLGFKQTGILMHGDDEDDIKGIYCWDCFSKIDLKNPVNR
jgi:hypothetical protein